MFRLFILLGLFLTFGDQAMATEEIAHRIVMEDGDIQIREYEPSVLAEVSINGTRREAPSQAFRTLFNFISGENAKAQEISMTTPVSQTASDAGDWKIAFYMPNEFEIGQTPNPNDQRISLREDPSRKMIAIKFSGRSTDENLFEHEKELRAYLKANEIDFKDQPIYAFYNSPFTPWFLRRNEVLFELKE